MLESKPRVTTIAVIAQPGAMSTILRITVPISPDRSANPMPIIATRMIPTGPKFTKLWTTEVPMNRMPSADSRVLTVVVTCSVLYVSGLMRS
jgi:hypothetical protein